MQNYILWILCSLWSVKIFAQLGVHGDIMLNSSLALAGVDLHFETGVLRSQAEQAEVLFNCIDHNAYSSLCFWAIVGAF